jgi:hypothetical protein
MPTDPELAYDDGSETEIVTPEDDPPRGGTWIDPESFMALPTDTEVDEGERLGHRIDIDDDDDNGLER